MSYAKKTLLPEEKILYYTKPHYIIFYSVFLWLAIAIWFGSNNHGFIGSVLLLIALIDFIGKLILYSCSEYVITDKRIIMKVGFIRRKSLEIFLDRIEGISVEQGVVGRVLNFGTVIVGGIGGSQNPFFYIPKPLEFHNNVQQQIQKSTGNPQIR